MKEERCSSCGALMHLDENQTKGHCNYCGAEYNLKSPVNVNIKFNSNTLNDMNEEAQKRMKLFVIFFALIFMAPFISMVIFEINSVVEDQPNTNNDIINNYDEAEKEMFNSKYEWYEGEQAYYWVEFLLDQIEYNNENNEIHKITVVYDEIEAITKEEISNLQNKLNENVYNLYFNYDEDGYINKLVISE